MNIESNRQVLFSLIKGEYAANYPNLTKLVQQKRLTKWFNGLFWIYDFYLEQCNRYNRPNTYGKFKLSCRLFASGYLKQKDHPSRAHKYLNYYCAVGFLKKKPHHKQNQMTHEGLRFMNEYLIADLIKPEIMGELDQRSEALLKHGISMSTMTKESLKSAKIMINGRYLASIVFPDYADGKDKIRQKRLILSWVLSLISERDKRDKYCTHDLIVNEFLKCTDDFKAGIVHQKKYINDLLKTYKSEIEKHWDYKTPNKADKERLNLQTAHWIYKPKEQKEKRNKVKPNDLKLVQDLMREEGNTSPVQQIYVKRDSKVSLKNVRRAFPRPYFITDSGELYTVDQGIAKHLSGSIQNGRRTYTIHLFDGTQKTFPDYKLIFLVYRNINNPDHCSPNARHYVLYERGSSQIERFAALHVHHLDWNRNNNKPENLKLLTESEHQNEKM